MQNKNILDHHYDSLRCGITTVDKTSKTFDNISAFVQKTHGKTHTAYTLDVEEVLSNSHVELGVNC